MNDLFLRSVPEQPSIPMEVGLNWRPFRSSSPVKGDKALVGRIPFHLEDVCNRFMGSRGSLCWLIACMIFLLSCFPSGLLDTHALSYL